MVEMTGQSHNHMTSDNRHGAESSSLRRNVINYIKIKYIYFIINNIMQWRGSFEERKGVVAGEERRCVVVGGGGGTLCGRRYLPNTW